MAKLIQIGCRHIIKLDGQSNKSTTATWSFSLCAFALDRSDKLPENNFPKTYEKLHCKGEPYRFVGYGDPSVHTHTQRHIARERHKSC